MYYLHRCLTIQKIIIYHLFPQHYLRKHGFLQVRSIQRFKFSLTLNYDDKCSSSTFCFEALTLPYLPPHSCNNHLLGAQVLACIAFFISLAGWWLAWISGLVALIILLLGCCITFDKNVWLVVGILSIIAAVGELLVAIRVVDNNMYCGGNNSADCFIGDAGTIILSIVALIMWTLVALVTINQFRSGGSAGSTSDDLPK